MPKEKKLAKFVNCYINMLCGVDDMITSQFGWISHQEIDKALKVEELELTDSSRRTYAMLVHQALGVDSFLQEIKFDGNGRKKRFKLTPAALALGDELAPKVTKSAYDIQNARRRNSREGKSKKLGQGKTDFKKKAATKEVDMIIKVYSDGNYNVTGAEHVNAISNGTDMIFVSKNGYMWRRMAS